MKSATVGPSPSFPLPTPDDDLMLRETNHRCSNDLQLVVSLLALQSRRVESKEARAALSDAAERVGVLARTRAAIAQERTPDLADALRQVCEALQLYAEPRSILISLHTDQAPMSLSARQITILSLVVNELMINAIKHAFQEGVSGRITVVLDHSAGGDVLVTVDDDGLPYPDPCDRSGGGLGLARRLMASVNGLLIAPTCPSKKFKLRMPLAAQQVPA